MKITIKLFAIFRETIGKDQLVMEVLTTDRVGDVVTKLTLDYPKLAEWRTGLRFARNLEFVDQNCTLAPGDEIAFIPPVSGG